MILISDKFDELEKGRKEKEQIINDLKDDCTTKWKIQQTELAIRSTKAVLSA